MLQEAPETSGISFETMLRGSSGRGLHIGEASKDVELCTLRSATVQARRVSG
jgi:hypothetical protein